MTEEDLMKLCQGGFGLHKLETNGKGK